MKHRICDSSNYRPFYLRRLTNNPVYGGKFSPITARPTLRNKGRFWGKYYVTCMYDVEPTIKSSKISVFQFNKCSRINLDPEDLTHVWFVGHNVVLTLLRYNLKTHVWSLWIPNTNWMAADFCHAHYILPGFKRDCSMGKIYCMLSLFVATPE